MKSITKDCIKRDMATQFDQDEPDTANLALDQRKSLLVE